MYRVDKIWSKMTIVEKRKTLAQDVINQVDLGWIIPARGVYCNVSIKAHIKNDLQKGLQQKNSCNVCAMGALMASSIIKTNNFNTSWCSTDIIYRLNSIFSKSHLRLIEAAFEKDLIHKSGTKGLVDNNGNYTDIVKKAIILGKQQYKSNKSRLKAIMKNIIQDEKGKFLGFKY